MQPTTTILDAVASLLAADSATLASVTALKVKLATAPFTPGPDLTPGDFTEANFDGYTAKSPTAGTQLFFVDPITAERTVQLVTPTGGLHWETTGVTNLPQTVYGWWVEDGAGTTVYGMGLLDAPVVLQAINDGLNLPPLQFQFLSGSPH